MHDNRTDISPMSTVFSPYHAITSVYSSKTQVSMKQINSSIAITSSNTNEKPTAINDNSIYAQQNFSTIDNQPPSTHANSALIHQEYGTVTFYKGTATQNSGALS